MPHPLQKGERMNDYGEDAAMPLEVSVFEPKTPFLYAGLMHMPGTSGRKGDRGSKGNGADRIEVTHEVVLDEISKGLHEVTGRPISALLNHCVVRKTSGESHRLLADFYATVRKRTSAKQRIATRAKKEAAGPSGMMNVQPESFGVADSVAHPTMAPTTDAPAVLASPATEAPAPAAEAAPPPPPNKGGRPKGSKTKNKRKRSKPKAKAAL